MDNRGMIRVDDISKNYKSFEECSHTDGEGIEFWYARDLQELLGYSKWENFEKVIERAEIACKNSKQIVEDHFPEVRKMVQTGSNTTIYKEQIILQTNM